MEDDKLNDENIAKKIIKSQNSIMVEYKNKIYISSYDSFDNEKDLISAIKECELPNGEFENRYDMTIYDDYNELIQDEYNQVYEDLYDVRTYR